MLLEAFAILGLAIKFHGVERVDPGAEGRIEARRQAGPLADRLQSQLARVVDHQPGAMMRHAREFGDRPLEEGHMAMSQSAQQQRGRQAFDAVQMLNESLRIGCAAGLVDQINRRPFLGADHQLQHPLGRKGVVAEDVVAQLVADHVDQAFADRQRQG